MFRAVFNALYFSGAHVLLQPLIGGAGAILTLHHVRPGRRDRFQPNRLLEVTPAFFEHFIRRLRRSGIDLVSIDEMHRRLSQGDLSRRFVAITFDDGYRDNREFAYPILKRYDVPFAIYVATSFADKVGELWWLALEAVVGRNNMVALQMEGRDVVLQCGSVREKREVYDQLLGWLRQRRTDQELRQVMREVAARYRVDIAAFCDELCMDWSEIAELAADPLVTIGAHTVNHPILAQLTDEAARAEMANSRAVIEAAIGVRPQHLAYPVGDRHAAGCREFRIASELGFKTAVTTRPGALFAPHANHLTALPRISINGEFQRQRYAQVLVSGTVTSLWNGLRTVNVS